MKWSALVISLLVLSAALVSLLPAGAADLPAAVAEGVASQAMSAPPAPVQPFGKAYIPYKFHEMVYFNNVEGDLEHHAFVRGNYMFATLTDVARHIGGSITWGPKDSFVEVDRKGKKVRIVPGTDVVIVDGNKEFLSRPTFRSGRLLYVPVRSFSELFGCRVHWEDAQQRAYVSFSD